MIKARIIAAVVLALGATIAVAAEGCGPIASVDDFYSNGWGFTPSNERFQRRTSIDRSNVETLSLKWAYQLEGGMSPHSYPVISSDSVFIGTQSGELQAIDRSKGCLRWSYDAASQINTAVTHGIVATVTGEQALLFFGTSNGRAHAVAAATGKPVWVTDVRDHSMGMLTGSPLYHDGRVYVPVSSMELVFAVLPWYGCCTFRGSLVALDAANGSPQWRTHMVDETPAVMGTHYFFVQRMGPSGAPVWSSPTIDAEAGLIYVGTGENYSSPATDKSDAIVAMDLATGSIKWAQQYLANDAFNVGCAIPGHPNCPEEDGPDLDFGAPPIITRTPQGQSIMLAGQKSGGVYALNPDTGERIWERFFGRGGILGGIHWGMAVNPNKGLLFVPISDMQHLYAMSEGESEPGLHALDMATGEVRWTAEQEDICVDRESCHPGLSAAIAATDELVFAGALDGVLRAYDADSGAIVWRFDTIRDYQTPDGAGASGGTLDTHGPMIAADMVFIQSGYAKQLLHGGNALLAFELKEPAP
ncbi:MAG: polyvinyl alcohol dehydrogenase (cytochrome) [Paraglaciecola psychrophila]|jgi:polyvinyl alcohol dehydrogenase (cytochrome)